MAELKILITGGGTGGHITPGIALYEEFRGRGVDAYFLATVRDKRFSISDDMDEKDILYYRAPQATRNIFKLPFFIFRFITSVIRGCIIIRKYSITAIIGMGGYVTAPALIAARLCGKPIFLCEQNTVPGKVTRYFEKYSEKIYGTFEASKGYMKFGDKFFHAGNPIRKKVLADVSREEARRSFNLGHCKKIILVLGGSQGATQINSLIAGLKNDFRDDFKETGFIWSTGEASYETYKKMIHDSMYGGSIYISPFIKKIGLAYKASDVAISRAGAGVMMELAAMGIPSILIPYPYAAMGHQEKNAAVFAAEGAAYMVDNSGATPAAIAPLLMKILGNPRIMKGMSDRGILLARRDAARIIAEDIAARCLEMDVKRNDVRPGKTD